MVLVACWLGLVSCLNAAPVAGATVTGGEMTVHGCGRDSVQGDVRYLPCAISE